VSAPDRVISDHQWREILGALDHLVDTNDPESSLVKEAMSLRGQVAKACAVATANDGSLLFGHIRSTEAGAALPEELPAEVLADWTKADELTAIMADSSDVIALSALLSTRMHRDVLEGRKVKPCYEEEDALRRILRDRGTTASKSRSAEEYRERAAGLLWLAEEAEKRERPTTSTFNGIVNEAGGPLPREAK
jgi:hypothetical protein